MSDLTHEWRCVKNTDPTGGELLLVGMNGFVLDTRPYPIDKDLTNSSR